MSAVGIVTITVGLLIVFTRGGPLVVAPAAYLRWVRGVLQKNNTTRILGAGVLGISAAMAWAGTTDDSDLAGFLLFVGMLGIAVGTVLMILPGVFPRGFVTAFLPAVEEERLPGWRVFGIAVTSAGFLLAYFGVLAL